MQTLIAEPTPAALCPACQAENRSRPRHRTAWLVLAALFALGLLWSNRYEYPLCEYDGCVRIDRWTGHVGWVWSDDPGGTDDTLQSVRSVRAERDLPLRAGATSASEL
jgi:hypothetical protein